MPKKPQPPTIPTGVVIHGFPVGVGEDGVYVLHCDPPVTNVYLHQLAMTYENEQQLKENRRLARLAKQERAKGLATVVVDENGRRAHVWNLGDKGVYTLVPVTVYGVHGTTGGRLATKPDGEKITLGRWTDIFMLTDEEARRLEVLRRRMDELVKEIDTIYGAHDIHYNHYRAEVRGFPPVMNISLREGGNGCSDVEKLPVQVLSGGQLGVRAKFELLEADSAHELEAAAVAAYHPQRGEPVIVIEPSVVGADTPVLAGPEPFKGAPHFHLLPCQSAGTYPQVFLATLPLDVLRDLRTRRTAVEKEMETLRGER